VQVASLRVSARGVLAAVGRGRRLDLALGEAFVGLEDRDRRQLQELVTGTLRARGRLDHLLGRHLPRGVESLPTPVLDVLRLAAYQLLRMDGVPAYAAVSQGVEQVRAAGGEGLARLANAVLRKVAADGEDLSRFPSMETDPAGFLSTWGSHPRWLVERWLARWTPEQVREVIEADNAIPPVVLQPWGITPADVGERLTASGIQWEPVRGGPGLRLGPGADPREALAAAHALIQDPAAALVVRYAAPPPGARIADLCAAPGGKALALLPSAGYVLASDPAPNRLALLVENARRLRVEEGRLLVVAARAEDPPLREADLVLVDVPCSGTGTLRRHPDARWRLRPQDIPALTLVQDRILDGAARVVPIGGFLVYSTCTLEPEENEERVRAFLGRHPGFRMAPEETPEVADFVDGEGFLRILPRIDGFDGAFGARMKRIR
jgi:16S rRNA (cytosine967-C5)-methyltransferase